MNKTPASLLALIMSKVYSFKTTQFIPSTLPIVWAYFSDPSKLPEITPRDMGFTVTSVFHGRTMYPGQVIEYKVKPVLGIPLYWMTEITHVEDQRFFVDEQRFGPYSFWHHQHHFRVVKDGVEMTDIVHYKIPFWFIGDIANAVFVRKKLEAIFNYRKTVVEEKWSNG